MTVAMESKSVDRSEFVTVRVLRDVAVAPGLNTDNAREVSPLPYPDAPPAFVMRGIMWLHRRMQRLTDSLLPANVLAFMRAAGLATSHLVGFAARHGIADLLHERPMTADEIATRTGLDADAVHRALRALAFQGVFQLSPDGRFSNSRISDALRSGQASKIREFAVYYTSISNQAAWLDLDRTMRSGKNACERMLGEGVWEWFDRHPDERETFAHAMMGMTVANAAMIARLYPFGEITRLCDVGGGRGTLLSELLIRHPHLRGVLCDNPGVIRSAETLFTQRGVRDRVDLVAGDFFHSVPDGCDAYLLKTVLHDWDDARSLTILKNVRSAMASGARLLVVEQPIERNENENVVALQDIQMMLVCNEGRERSRAEYRQLLEASGFTLARSFESPMIAVLEARAV